MPTVKYENELTDNDRKTLLKIINTGSSPAKTILRANILLVSDRHSKDTYLSVKETAERFHTSTTTVQKVRASYANNGLQETLGRKKRTTPPVEPKVTGDVEAHIIALACGEPPDGYSRWTVRLLADKSVELQYVDSISAMTISRLLKKTHLSLT